MADTCINTVRDPDKLSFSTDEKHYINMMLKLHEKYPDDIEIMRMPDKNLGCLHVYFPKKWLNIKPPRQMSEEQRQKAAERLREYKFQIEHAD